MRRPSTLASLQPNLHGKRRDCQCHGPMAELSTRLPNEKRLEFDWEIYHVIMAMYGPPYREKRMAE